MRALSIALFVPGITAAVVVGSAIAVRGGPVATVPSRISCPSHLLVQASATASIVAVTDAARRLLARQTFHSQGRTYRLTPQNAPIDYVHQVATSGTPHDEAIPGLLAIHHAAAAMCGGATAQASWAIHYSLPVSVIAGSGGYPFIIKTRAGWRFWGYWCGAGQSLQWRKTHCL